MVSLDPVSVVFLRLFLFHFKQSNHGFEATKSVVSVYRDLLNGSRVFFFFFYSVFGAVMRKRYHQVTKWFKHGPIKKCVLNILLSFYSCGSMLWVPGALSSSPEIFDPEKYWLWSSTTVPTTSKLIYWVTWCAPSDGVPPHNLFALCQAERLSLFSVLIPRLCFDSFISTFAFAMNLPGTKTKQLCWKWFSLFRWLAILRREKWKCSTR